jgi:ferritin-like metal-binding protein YciE
MAEHMDNLQGLLEHQLKDLYDAEHQITDALPKMKNAAKSESLKNAFDKHLKTTEQQIKRLEQVFDMLGTPAVRQHCKGMEGLIKEGDELIKVDADPDVRDAGLITAAQKVEHYEMAGYGSARTYARMLGLNRAADMLQQTLDEEGQTDEQLTSLAQRINVKAQR